MAHIGWSAVTLRITGQTLVPEEITKLLNRSPTKSHLKGQSVASPSTGRVVTKKTGAWHLQAADRKPADIDGQVSELLESLSKAPEAWKALATRFELDLVCGLFLDGSNEETVISDATLRALGERHIKLSLDVFGNRESHSCVEGAQAAASDGIEP